ncbi:hypothetical protein Godav_027218, partial [Gossypium davidsonii]|nr:hypothetical protein [Gossypium davidsonii]
GDAKGVEVNGEGDDEGVESDGEGDLEKVESGSIVREDNDRKVVADEYAGDFATSDGVDNVADEYVGDFETSDGLDNVAATCSGGEKDENETKVWDSDKHGSLIGFDKVKNMKMVREGGASFLYTMISENLVWEYCLKMANSLRVQFESTPKNVEDN